MKIKLTLLYIIYFVNISSSETHIYKISSNNGNDPRKLNVTYQMPLLNTNLEYFSAIVLNSIIIKKEKYAFSNLVGLTANKKQLSTQTDKKEDTVFWPAITGKGGSAFLAEYLRLNINCTPSQSHHIFITGGFDNAIYFSQLKRILKELGIDVNDKTRYTDVQLKEILEKHYETLGNTFVDLHNIEIGFVVGLANKILNTIRYCSKKKINMLYFLVPEQNKTVMNLILSQYEHFKIISGSPVFLTNTKEALDFFQKLNNTTPPEFITITSPLNSINSLKDIEEIQIHICKNLKNYIIETINFFQKDSYLNIKRELDQCIHELELIIDNYNLSNFSNKEIMSELYLLLLEKIKTNKVNSLIDELIMMIMTIENFYEKIYLKKNNTVQTISIENEIIENIPDISSKEKNQIRLKLITTLMNSLINILLVKHKQQKTKDIITNNAMIKFLIIKLNKNNTIPKDIFIVLNSKYIDDIYRIINNIYNDINSNCPLYTTSLINFFLTLQTIYFNQYKKTAPLYSTMEKSQWHCFFAAPITENNLLTYIDMYSQSLNNYNNESLDKKNIKKKIANLVLILNDFCFDKKKDAKKNIFLIHFILFFLERLSTISENYTYLINDIIQYYSLFKQEIMNQEDIYDNILKIIESDIDNYKNTSTTEKNESYMYGLNILSKFLNKNIIDFSNIILKNTLSQYIKEFLQNNISLPQLISVYKYIEQYENCNAQTIINHHNNITKDIKRITEKKDMLLHIEKKINKLSQLKINDYKKIKMLYIKKLINLRELVNLSYKYIIEESASDENLYIMTNLYPDLNTYLNCCTQYNKYKKN